MQWKVYPADLLSVALDKREIAAISGSEPFSYRLLETGKYQLIASNMTGDYANLSCCVLGVSGSTARDHKPAAAALTRAILEAHSYAAEHPESVAQSFLAHALNTSEAEVSGILHGQGTATTRWGGVRERADAVCGRPAAGAGDQTGHRSPSVCGEYLCQRIRLSRRWRAQPAARRCGRRAAGRRAVAAGRSVHLARPDAGRRWPFSEGWALAQFAFGGGLLLLALSYRYWRARGARVLHAGKWLALLPVLFAARKG